MDHSASKFKLQYPQQYPWKDVGHLGYWKASGSISARSNSFPNRKSGMFVYLPAESVSLCLRSPNGCCMQWHLPASQGPWDVSASVYMQMSGVNMFSCLMVWQMDTTVPGFMLSPSNITLCFCVLELVLYMQLACKQTNGLVYHSWECISFLLFAWLLGGKNIYFLQLICCCTFPSLFFWKYAITAKTNRHTTFYQLWSIKFEALYKNVICKGELCGLSVENCSDMWAYGCARSSEIFRM